MSTDPYVAVPQLDEWRVLAEIKELAAAERDLANRMKCPICGEVGIWLVVGCVDFAEPPRPIPDAAYCAAHGPSAHAPEQGILSMNECGWVEKSPGRYWTWDEGYPRDGDALVPQAQPHG